MNTKEFQKNYLSYYLLLESNFIDTFNYVSVEIENYRTYSNIYLQLLLAIGSEIDIMKKFVVKLYYPNEEKVEKNKNKQLLDAFPKIRDLEIKFRETGALMKPWRYEKEPDWWTAYNEIKHNRMDTASKLNDDSKKYYQHANLENVIMSLGALFSLEFIAYRKLAIDADEEPFVPIVKTLFSINNLYWENVQHGNGPVFVNGDLYIQDQSSY